MNYSKTLVIRQVSTPPKDRHPNFVLVRVSLLRVVKEEVKMVETIDVIEDFPWAIIAEKKDRDVLILSNLSEPWIDDYDGTEYTHELTYKWLSNDDVHCVLGQETIYVRNVDYKKSLFEQFYLF
jgi:hypothetical protein